VFSSHKVNVSGACFPCTFYYTSLKFQNNFTVTQHNKTGNSIQLTAMIEEKKSDYE